MIERIKVPRFSSALAARISNLAAQAYEKSETVSQEFQHAQDVLLDALGLADWSPPKPLTYTARATDVFISGRIDAQYFRPLFAGIKTRLDATKRAVELGSILSVNARGRQPLYDSAGLPVVNSKHVRAHRVILGGNRTAVEAGSPVVIQHGDVLLNGTGVGTIGRAAPYLHQTRALPDSHVTVLRTIEVREQGGLGALLFGQGRADRHRDRQVPPDAFTNSPGSTANASAICPSTVTLADTSARSIAPT